MSGKMNWGKARKFAAADEKYTPGKILENGRKVPNVPRDSLDARAREAEKRWLKGMPKRDHP